jgi:hypothetical protein
MISELKSEVEKQFARKITNRGDCEALAQDIYEKTGSVLSYNTLRRIYGLAGYKRPRESTLDQLAKYCGFITYVEFCQRFHEFDSWPETEEVHVLMADSDLIKICDLLRRRKVRNQEFASTFATITRDLIYRDRLDLLYSIFETEDFHFENLHFDIVSQIGSMVGLLFRDPQFLPISKKLLHSANFRNLVFKSFVDYTSFNGHYGEWVKYLNRLTEIDQETKAFVICLNMLIGKLNMTPISTELKNALPSFMKDWHPILRGRIFVITYLQEDDDRRRLEYLKQFNAIIEAQPDLKQELLYIPTVHSLLFPDFLLSGFIYDHLEKGNKVNFWYQLSLVSIEQVFSISMLIRNKDYEQARHKLQQLTIGQIRHGYKNLMELFLSFFSLCVEKKLNNFDRKLELQFIERRQKLSYPLFTDAYFEHYFDD